MPFGTENKVQPLTGLILEDRCFVGVRLTPPVPLVFNRLLEFRRGPGGWTMEWAGMPYDLSRGPSQPLALDFRNGRLAVGDPQNNAVQLFSYIPEAEPTALRLDAATTDTLAVSWQDITRNESSTDIFLAEAEPFPAEPALTVDANVTTATLNVSGPDTRWLVKAMHRNDEGPGPESAAIEAWTLAEVPRAPELALAETDALTLALAADANPARTEYAIYSPTLAAYVQRDGSLAAAPDWQTRAAWGTVRIGGLAPGAEHAFTVRARNGALAETEQGPALAARTFAPAGVIVR